jgi:hypothetical protein
VKNIIVFAEDTQIAVRKSEIIGQGLERSELERQLKNIDDLHLNLNQGQQCVRDFFLCLKENLESWFDLYQIFSLNMIYSTTCLSCGKVSESETNQLYVEMDVPPDGSKLNEHVEKQLNGYCKVEYQCHDECNVNFEAENRSMIKSCEASNFLIVMLRRVVQGEEGPEIVQNRVNSIDNICIRYIKFTKNTRKMLINICYRDSSRTFGHFEPIALVEHQGQMAEDGKTRGHYICDLEDQETLRWFRTNDNQTPVPISLDDVTKNPVVLYRKKHSS